MTPLEAKISALLDECEGLLEPYKLTTQKWVIISDTKRRLDTIVDEKGSISTSIAKAIGQIRDLQSYKIARAVFERDKVFSAAVSTAGYWATFDGLIPYLINNAASFKNDLIAIDQTKAIQSLRNFRIALTKKTLRFEASARLMGVTLTAKSFSLPDDIVLYRLNRRERNYRQPTFEPYLSSGWHDQFLTDHPAELRVSVTVPVDHSQDDAHFKAKNDAQHVANELFNKVVEAILVTTRGKAKLSYITLKGGIEQISSGRSLLQEIPPNVNLTIRKGDLDKISAAYDLVSGGKRSDKTLSRSLHRFLLGRKRTDLVDKLVDYVIAWEAILLTQDRNPIPQELSYRFSLNGASIISSASRGVKPNDIYKKMKSAYSARSSIVHGGSDNEIKEKLKIGEFANTHELCSYLESNFRRVLFWLISLNTTDRPYIKKGGWESLIWS